MTKCRCPQEWPLWIDGVSKVLHADIRWPMVLLMVGKLCLAALSRERIRSNDILTC